jgi:cysteine synthase
MILLDVSSFSTNNNALPTVLDAIGNTPTVMLGRIPHTLPHLCPILMKLESRLPGGSIKDRVGLHLITVAEQQGAITPYQSTLIEATSGNSGIALAMVAAIKGYGLIIVMPENCSIERRTVLQAYGASIVLTPATLGMAGACEYAKRLAQQTSNAYLLDQFNNPANAAIHEQTTGPELWASTQGRFDCFVASVGTGGTLTGVGRYLKRQNPNIEIVAVEPAESPVLSGGKAGAHLIQGIGAGFVPANLDTSLISSVITVTSQEALAYSRRLAREEGLLSGISSGANLAAAIEWGQQPQNRGKTVATIQCSGGERYLSSPLFDTLRQQCEQQQVVKL